MGDVYLAGVGRADAGKSGPATPEPSRIDAASPSGDNTVWSAIKDLSVAAVFEEFVHKSPASLYAREGR